MNSNDSSSEQNRAFELLSQEVKRWIHSQGWQQLRKVQTSAILAITANDQDVVIGAPTASGKTEAAFMPLLSAEAPKGRGFEIIYTAPTKALINDQADRLIELAEATGRKAHAWHGDVDSGRKAAARRKPEGILLITPESLEANLILRGTQARDMFGNARTVVIDELHAFLDQERGMHLRSILHRIDEAAGRKLRRIGLSATLADMKQAASYLSYEDPTATTVVSEDGDPAELALRLEVHLNDPMSKEPTAPTAIAGRIDRALRGTPNLVFAGSRQNVEFYADRLREIAEREHRPLTFHPHHANLPREHRQDLEHILRDGRSSAVCTSTLELGIDLGHIDSVAQIGPPPSVASLRQRLGRCGRREGKTKILRLYTAADAAASDSPLLDQLQLGMLKSIAATELLMEGWCEPVPEGKMHLSTLVHQTLALIAQHGGRDAAQLYTTLCANGPFKRVDRTDYVAMLRRLGDDKALMIEQDSSGTLLLGKKGEKVVNHYSFYAAFNSPEEFKVLHGSRPIGTVPTTSMLREGDAFILMGQRWLITHLNPEERTLRVIPSRQGALTNFGAGYADTHDGVTEKMREIAGGTEPVTYLDEVASNLLATTRRRTKELGLDRNPVAATGVHERLIATWKGSKCNRALALLLKSQGCEAAFEDGFVETTRASHPEAPTPDEALAALSNLTPEEALACLDGIEGALNEKFHNLVPEFLKAREAAENLVDVEGALAQAQRATDWIDAQHGGS